MSANFPVFTRSRNRGAALPIAMIFLFLITLTGVSMMETAVDNQKMTNNYQHHALSYQAADSVLYKLLTVDSEDVGPNYTATFLSDFPGDFENVADQPDMTVDLEMNFIEEKKNVFVPGFEVGSSAFIYEASSTGDVGTASVTNKMGVALIRPPTE